MSKKTDGITKEQFLTSKITLPPKAKYLGCWEDADVIYGVYEYPNGAHLRMTYWKPAGMVLACVRDYYGNYHCLSSNVKTMEELIQIIEQFDWKMCNAKKQKQWTVGTVRQTQEPQVDKQEITDILGRLNSI